MMVIEYFFEVVITSSWVLEVVSNGVVVKGIEGYRLVRGVKFLGLFKRL